MIFSRRISAAQRKERGGPGEGVSHGAPAVGKYLIYHACHWRGGREGSKRASGVGKRESVLGPGTPSSRWGSWPSLHGLASVPRS